jgi:mannose-6-phosphate isomerase-like protein (cupin superfamily)
LRIPGIPDDELLRQHWRGAHGSDGALGYTHRPTGISVRRDCDARPVRLIDEDLLRELAELLRANGVLKAGAGAAEASRVNKVNLADAFARFADHWSPKVVGALNGQHVKLVKFRGPFVWHRHEAEDELFLVVRGAFRMEFQDRTVELSAGEFLIVPRGVEHRPVADEEVEVLLFEPAGTLNTGDSGGELTVANPEWLP